MMKEKMTKKDWFALMETVVEKAELPQAEKEGALAFIKREVELLNKKSSNSRDTKRQEENQALAEIVLAELGKIGKPVAIAELIKTSEVLKDYTTQKLTPIMKSLLADEKVVVTVEKKRNFYTVA